MKVCGYNVPFSDCIKVSIDSRDLAISAVALTAIALIVFGSLHLTGIISLGLLGNYGAYSFIAIGSITLSIDSIIAFLKNRSVNKSNDHSLEPSIDNIPQSSDFDTLKANKNNEEEPTVRGIIKIEVPNPKNKERTPLKFGSKAFELIKDDSDKISLPGVGKLIAIVRTYKEFDEENQQTTANWKLLSSDRRETAYYHVLIKDALTCGFPRYPRLKEMVFNQLGFIIFKINPKNKELSDAEKNTIVKKLAEAFGSCQDEQVRTIQAIYQRLTNKGTLDESLKVLWQEYKMQILDQMIMERHPNCLDHNKGSPEKQFVHIKSRYMVECGQELGICDPNIAKTDDKMPNDVFEWDSKAQFIEAFKKRLNLYEFAKNIACDINNPNQETSLIDKDLVQKWGKNNNQDSFGYYDSEKNYSDLGTRGDKNQNKYYIQITEDNECFMAPYISVDEVYSILKFNQIID